MAVPYTRGLPGLIAGERDGVALYETVGTRAELVLLHALMPAHGRGTALVEALTSRLAQAGVRELWLTTTNDNLDPLRFYQRRGFRLMEVLPRVMEEARKLKPTIPMVGEFGIRISDELRLMRPPIAEHSLR